MEGTSETNSISTETIHQIHLLQCRVQGWGLEHPGGVGGVRIHGRGLE